MCNLKKILLFLYSLSYVYAGEEMVGYIYPVDTIYHDGILKMCMLYQKFNGLELYFWDPITHKAILGLLSFFQPSGLSVLPNKQAFSFIDNDRIKIKYVDKRSPKSLDLYGPYDLTTIQWIDNENFYFSAKERRHYNLFHATTDGDLFRITVSNSNHYVYPQKIDATLFFIEKTENNEFAIKSIEYPRQELSHRIARCNQPVSLEDEVQFLMRNETARDAYKPLINIKDSSTLVFFDKKTVEGEIVSFLHMLSSSEGFFIRYSDHIHKNQKSFYLDYYALYYDNNNDNWQYEKLFQFSIPLYCILQERGRVLMSESILPFLPFHDSGIIYFTQYNEDLDSSDIYEYSNKAIKKVSQSVDSQHLFFAPRRFNDTIFCGGNILLGKNPCISLSNDGTQYFDLDHIK